MTRYRPGVASHRDPTSAVAVVVVIIHGHATWARCPIGCRPVGGASPPAPISHGYRGYRDNHPPAHQPTMRPPDAERSRACAHPRAMSTIIRDNNTAHSRTPPAGRRILVNRFMNHSVRRAFRPYELRAPLLPCPSMCKRFFFIDNADGNLKDFCCFVFFSIFFCARIADTVTTDRT